MNPSSYNPKDIGVIIGRFQVPELHQAHRALIEFVAGKHRKVVVALGVAPTLCTLNNPLDFVSRQRMINAEYPSVSVIAVPDRKSDAFWSADLDSRLREAYPVGDIILYGGRDSFIEHYTGVFTCQNLDLVLPVSVSGTEVRESVCNEVRLTPDWRAGVIYATNNRFPTAYPTIDVAILNRTNNSLLLVRKLGEDGYRFPGGFVQPSEDTLEQTVRREVYEETGVEIGNIRYVGSARIDDWRYRREIDKIMTVLFSAFYVSGRLQAGDDVHEARWFPLKALSAMDFVEEHRPLLVMLQTKQGFYTTASPITTPSDDEHKLNERLLADV